MEFRLKILVINFHRNLILSEFDWFAPQNLRSTVVNFRTLKPWSQWLSKRLQADVLRLVFHSMLLLLVTLVKFIVVQIRPNFVDSCLNVAFFIDV